jgi:glycosyltransferase involved in cell wall biosynthesis
MDQNNCFSILICAYNEEKNIANKIINSLKIKGNILEIIIVNDFCRDNTEKIITTYQNEYPKIKLIKNKYKKGKAGALLSGVEYAQGNWLVLTDCDVMVESDVLDNIKNVVNDKNILVIGSRAINRRIDWELLEIMRMKILPTWLVRGQLMVVRNNKILFANLNHADDVEIALKAIENNGRVIHCEQLKFTDHFHDGVNFYRQFWRRALAMNKAIFQNILIILATNNFSLIEKVKNLLFFFFCYVLPLFIIIVIAGSIYFYWKILFLYILIYPVIILSMIMVTSALYALLTWRHKGNLNW